jgi:two-component system, cell cycle response regulator DivK
MAKVMIVDDILENLELLERRLTKRGYTVILANSGMEAIAKARSEKPHVILMDIQMPEMDGYETTRRLKADADTQAIPVVALTASVMQSDLEKATQAGVIGHLAKPVDLPALIAKLEALIPAGA